MGRRKQDREVGVSALTKYPEDLYDKQAFGAFVGDHTFRFITVKTLS